MAVVVVVVMMLGGRGIGYDGRRLRGLLYDICSLLRTGRILVVCARDSCGARRRATFSSYDTSWDSILIMVLLDTDETHGDLGGEDTSGMGR
jgi:hypothetical protein